MSLRRSQDEEFKKHEVTEQSRLDGGIGINELGQLEGIAVYKRGVDRTMEPEEYTFDLAIPDRKPGAELPETANSAQMLCPKCGQSLLIDGVQGPWKVRIHWAQARTCSDGKLRPTVSITGAPVRCDYSMHEIDGVAQPKTGIHAKCNWRGKIEEGRIYDHAVSSGIVVARG